MKANLSLDYLLGKKITDYNTVFPGYSDSLLSLKLSDGTNFPFGHYQDCCESVYLADVAGALDDIVDSEVLRVFTNKNHEDGTHGDSCTYTFYTITTFKGSVTPRFNGESNGYYSEEVNLWLE